MHRSRRDFNAFSSTVGRILKNMDKTFLIYGSHFCIFKQISLFDEKV